MMLFALTHLPHKVDFATSPLGCPHSSVGKESACNAGDTGLIPGSPTSAGEGTGYPLQYSWASLVVQGVIWETWVRYVYINPKLLIYPSPSSPLW